MAMTATVSPPLTAAEPKRRRAGVPTLAARRLALTVRTPRALIAPVLTPVLFAIVIAPALAATVANPAHRAAYMTFIALATAGLLIPLNCMFSGIGVIVDRQQGAMRELLVAPVRRSSIVLGNLVAAMAITAVQLVVLVAAAAARGAQFQTTGRVAWFLAAAGLFCVVMYGLAEIVVTRIPTTEEYVGAVPAIAIVPFFFGGSLFPISVLPHWLADVARFLPLTHALALFRYGLTGDGVQALRNIWGVHDPATMAWLSLAVVAAYAALFLAGAVRLFARSATS